MQLGAAVKKCKTCLAHLCHLVLQQCTRRALERQTSGQAHDIHPTAKPCIQGAGLEVAIRAPGSSIEQTEGRLIGIELRCIGTLNFDPLSILVVDQRDSLFAMVLFTRQEGGKELTLLGQDAGVEVEVFFERARDLERDGDIAVETLLEENATCAEVSHWRWSGLGAHNGATSGRGEGAQGRDTPGV